MFFESCLTKKIAESQLDNVHCQTEIENSITINELEINLGY